MSQQSPLVVHIVYALNTGGLENGLVNIINRMPPDRYRHAIVCLTTSGRFAELLDRKDITIFELDKPPGNSFSTFAKVRKILKQLKPAIVHTRNLAALEMQLSTLLLRGVRRVHGEHGREINDPEGRNKKYNALRKVMSLIVHRYVAVSRDLEHWLLNYMSFAPGKVVQIYNGVDHQRFYRVDAAGSKASLVGVPDDFLRAETVVLGTVGRLDPVKNQKLIFEAIALLKAQHMAIAGRLRLLLVGDGPLRKDLRDTAEKLGVRDLVCFTGDRADVAELMQVMDVFVLPSVAEGISNTILEAMSSSLPVIATEVGGNPELVEEGTTGRLIPNRDAQALADAMLELIEQPELRRSMGAAGRKKVEQQFDWDQTVERYMAVYDKLLA